MECESEEAQAIEKLLLSNIVNHTLFCDDTVVNDYIGFSYGGYFQPFNLPVEIEHASSDGGSLGHHFVEQIHDLEQDFHKLQKSDYGIVNKREVDAKMAYYNDLLGDILPAKIKGQRTVLPAWHTKHRPYHEYGDDVYVHVRLSRTLSSDDEPAGR